MDIRFLYKDKSLVICEKPTGISSESPGLPDLISRDLHRIVYPVHRLDYGTGGVCIQACTKDACTALQRLFSEGKVCKEYLAVISGKPDSDKGIYRDLLYHDPRLNKSYVVKKMRKGVKEAICSWQVVDSVDSDDSVLSLVHVFLGTGRTHQIRVQFASHCLPLVGDRKYGSRLSAEYPALWANRIFFPHPYIPERKVEAESLPPDRYPWNRFSFHGINLM